MAVLENKMITLLGKVLDAATLRQRVISHNMANVNTPGFKKSEVLFEDELRKVLADTGTEMVKTHEGHLGGASDLADVVPRVKQDMTTGMRSDGNNVDVEQQMVTLAMNTINYNVTARLLAERLAMLRYTMSEGRR